MALTESPSLFKEHSIIKYHQQVDKCYQSHEIQDLDATCSLPNGQIDPVSGVCTCSSDYYGDDCSELKCRNGGTSSFGICACANGYYGQFCDNCKYCNSVFKKLSRFPFKLYHNDINCSYNYNERFIRL